MRASAVVRRIPRGASRPRPRWPCWRTSGHAPGRLCTARARQGRPERVVNARGGELRRTRAGGLQRAARARGSTSTARAHRRERRLAPGWGPLRKTREEPAKRPVAAGSEAAAKRWRRAPLAARVLLIRTAGSRLAPDRGAALRRRRSRGLARLAGALLPPLQRPRHGRRGAGATGAQPRVHAALALEPVGDQASSTPGRVAGPSCRRCCCSPPGRGAGRARHQPAGRHPSRA
jgi:hypothetical protein